MFGMDLLAGGMGGGMTGGSTGPQTTSNAVTTTLGGNAGIGNRNGLDQQTMLMLLAGVLVVAVVLKK